MRVYGSRRGFCDAVTVEIVCQSLALRSLFDVGGQGLIAFVRSRLKSAR
jgi:hypothetical protein